MPSNLLCCLAQIVWARQAGPNMHDPTCIASFSTVYRRQHSPCTACSASCSAVCARKLNAVAAQSLHCLHCILPHSRANSLQAGTSLVECPACAAAPLLHFYCTFAAPFAVWPPARVWSRAIALSRQTSASCCCSRSWRRIWTSSLASITGAGASAPPAYFIRARIRGAHIGMPSPAPPAPAAARCCWRGSESVCRLRWWPWWAPPVRRRAMCAGKGRSWNVNNWLWWVLRACRCRACTGKGRKGKVNKWQWGALRFGPEHAACIQRAPTLSYPPMHHAISQVSKCTQ